MRLVGSGLIRYAELCTVTRNLFIQSERIFAKGAHPMEKINVNMTLGGEGV